MTSNFLLGGSSGGGGSGFIDVTAVQLTSVQGMTDNTKEIVSWDEAVHNSLGAWSAGAPTRLTCQPGFGFARLTWRLNYNTSADASLIVDQIDKNGSVMDTADLNPRNAFAQGRGGEFSRGAVTAWLVVVPGDWFELSGFAVDIQGSGNLDSSLFNTWMQMEQM